MVKKNSLQRFRQIASVLAQYGFGYIIDKKIKNTGSSPENLRRAFETLGPTFIKIGQILSTRPDMLPIEYITELQKLQDNAPTIDYESISALFYNEFSTSIDDAFLSFDKTPIASASIAQVHRAVLKDGRNVIVKVQRPDIEENMELDISILQRLVNLTKARFEDALIDPKEALDEVLSISRKETNFKEEEASIIRFSELNKNVKFIGIPKLIQSISSFKVLTMEYIDGFKINDLERFSKEGYAPKDIAYKLANSYFKQIFEDGFFHGDPHPGNLLIKDGKIYFIDFGIMGEISDSLKGILNEIMLSVAYRDTDKLIGALLSLGISKGRINRNRLFEDIDYFFALYLSVPIEKISISQVLQDIFDIAKRNNIRLPRDLILLTRTLVIIEGVVTEIYPEIKILDIAVSYVKTYNKFNLVPSLNELLLNSYILAKSTVEIPSKMLRLINNMNNGRLKIQLEHKNLSKPLNDLNRMVNRLVFAILCSSIIISSSLILNNNAGPKIHGFSIIGVTGYIAAAILGFWLLISIIRSGKL